MWRLLEETESANWGDEHCLDMSAYLNAGHFLPVFSSR